MSCTFFLPRGIVALRCSFLLVCLVSQIVSPRKETQKLKKGKQSNKVGKERQSGKEAQGAHNCHHFSSATNSLLWLANKSRVQGTKKSGNPLASTEKKTEAAD
jgi:hypothetical protein